MDIIPLQVDFMNIRSERQKINNLLVYTTIINNDYNKFDQSINNKELGRILEELQISKTQLLDKCKEDILFGKLLAGRISKVASRQGSKDETYQLDICNSTANRIGINIENLSSTAYRPTKEGLIVSSNDMRKNEISKDMCLKSFDGKITGKVNGWIFAKIVYGYGGHRDNVFEEAQCLCDWVLKYKQESNELFVILIDTDTVNRLTLLKNKYINTKNLLIADHIEFQTYLINTYYVESI